MGYVNLPANVRAAMRQLRSARHKKLREELVAARKAAGFTQHGLAAKLGRSPSYVGKYEAGERRLEVMEFVEVCAILGADPGAVLKRVRD